LGDERVERSQRWVDLAAAADEQDQSAGAINLLIGRRPQGVGACAADAVFYMFKVRLHFFFEEQMHSNFAPLMGESTK